MHNIAAIAVCLLAGLWLQHRRVFPEQAPQVLNLYVIYVALPALILWRLPELPLQVGALLPALIAWLVMGITALFVWLLAKRLHWSREVTGVVMLLAPLGNTSFVGFPLIEATVGASGLPYAIIYDQLGSFLMVSSYGFWVLAHYSGAQASVKTVVKKIVTFPPFIATLLALCLLPWEYPQWMWPLLERIGNTLVPVVMVAVGLQWQLRLDRTDMLPVTVGLGSKLLLCPLIAAALLWVMGASAYTTLGQVTILEAAMAPMITAGALAASHGLAPRLAATMVGYGLLLGLLSVPLIHWLLLS